MKDKTAQVTDGFGTVAIVMTVVIVALVGIGSWYVWQARAKNAQSIPSIQRITSNQTNSSNNQGSKRDVFRVPELGVQFTAKEGINPLYNHTLDTGTWNNITYHILQFSTQQLVDKGAAEAHGGKNACSFTTGPISNNFALTTVSIFNSPSDALALLKATENSKLTNTSMTPDNGFFTIQGKVFYVSQGVGGGLCLQDSSFESQQWQLLHDSLMTFEAAS